MYSLMDLDLAKQINRERYAAAEARRAARTARIGRRGWRPRRRVPAPVAQVKPTRAAASPAGCLTPMGCTA